MQLLFFTLLQLFRIYSVTPWLLKSVFIFSCVIHRLPVDLDLKQISSVLSSDGILSVEAALPGSNISLPGEIVIPIHMMDKQLPAKSDGQCLTSNS